MRDSKVHFASVRRHCCSDRQRIAVVNAVADSGAQLHRPLAQQVKSQLDVFIQ